MTCEYCDVAAPLYETGWWLFQKIGDKGPGPLFSITCEGHLSFLSRTTHEGVYIYGYTVEVS
jgi:hypothetical protein